MFIFWRVKRIIAWLLASITFLILFQSFYFFRQLELLYILSKVGVPAIGAILMALGVVKVPLDYILVVIVYIILALFSSLMSWLYFGQDLLVGIAAQVKMFNVFVYPAAFLFFKYLRLNTFIRLDSLTMKSGGVLLLVFLSFYMIVGDEIMDAYSAYTTHSASKGSRWIFPQTVIVFCAFYSFVCLLNVSGRISKSVIYAAYLSFFFFYFVIFFQQKMQLFSIVLVFGIYMLWKANCLTRLYFILFLAAISLPILYLISDVLTGLMNFQYDSLIIRGRTIEIILSELASSQTVFLCFGFGTLLSVSGRNLQDIYGTSFWPADVGWVGILYEFGAFGVIAMLIMWVWVAVYALRGLHKSRSLISQSASLYIISLFVLNILVPKIVFGIGEIMVCLAIIESERFYSAHRPIEYSGALNALEK